MYTSSETNRRGALREEMKAIYESRTAVSSDGTTISIRDYGAASDSAIVLIHGYCCSQLVFARQVQSDLAKRHRLVTYDLRGHGESGKPADPTAYNTNRLWSDDLNAVLDELRLQHVVLVGWSMGGRVCGQLSIHTRRRPGARREFRRYPGIGRSEAALPRTGRAAYPRRLSPPTGNSSSREPLASCVPAPPHPSRERISTLCSAPPWRRLWWRARGSYQWHIDYGDALRKVTVPVLASHGLADRLCLPVASEAIVDRMPNVELSLYPAAGHMPFWESAPRFNRELDQFAARCLPRATFETTSVTP